MALGYLSEGWGFKNYGFSLFIRTLGVQQFWLEAAHQNVGGSTIMALGYQSNS